MPNSTFILSHIQVCILSLPAPQTKNRSEHASRRRSKLSFPTTDQGRIEHAIRGELIAERQPAGARVVRSSENFQLFSAGKQTLSDSVDFVWLARSLAHFRHEHIAIDIAIHKRRTLDADQTVLLGVIQPMP